MFKKIFKGRQPIPSKDVPSDAAPGGPIMSTRVFPVTGYPGIPPPSNNVYPGNASPGTMDYLSDTPSSVLPVDYNASPPSEMGSSNFSSSTMSPVPVDYTTSPPTDMPNMNHAPHTSSPLAYNPHAGQPPSARPLPQNEFANNGPQWYQPPDVDSFNQFGEPPAELHGSTVPSRHELPVASTPAQHLPIPSNPPCAPNHPPSPHSPQYTTPSSFASTTTLVPSPRVPQSPPLPSPHSPSAKPQAFPSPPLTQSADAAIKKYTVDIFCPLKRDTRGVRRQQIPRDVREFRLAKVALIPIVAGARRFVSLDVVFGGVDQAYARLVEKHFSFCSETLFSKMGVDAVIGGQVYTVGPMNIAYQEGERETVYVKFRGVDEKEKFKADFFDMQRYVE